MRTKSQAICLVVSISAFSVCAGPAVAGPKFPGSRDAPTPSAPVKTAPAPTMHPVPPKVFEPAPKPPKTNLSNDAVQKFHSSTNDVAKRLQEQRKALDLKANKTAPSSLTQKQEKVDAATASNVKKQAPPPSTSTTTGSEASVRKHADSKATPATRAMVGGQINKANRADALVKKQQLDRVNKSKHQEKSQQLTKQLNKKRKEQVALTYRKRADELRLLNEKRRLEVKRRQDRAFRARKRQPPRKLTRDDVWYGPLHVNAQKIRKDRGIPDNWTARASDNALEGRPISSGGVVFTSPSGAREVRFMPANPKAANASQRRPYVVETENGRRDMGDESEVRFLDAQHLYTEQRSATSHVPFEDWFFLPD